MDFIFYTTNVDPSNIRDRDTSNGTTIAGQYITGDKGTKELGLTILSETVPTYNYCYIGALNKYYFIDNPIKGQSKNEWLLRATEDVLKTFWNSLQNNEALIERQENDYNNMLVDNMLPAENDSDIIFKKMTNAKTFNNTNYIICLNKGVSGKG